MQVCRKVCIIRRATHSSFVMCWGDDVNVPDYYYIRLSFFVLIWYSCAAASTEMQFADLPCYSEWASEGTTFEPNMLYSINMYIMIVDGCLCGWLPILVAKSNSQKVELFNRFVRREEIVHFLIFWQYCKVVSCMVSYQKHLLFLQFGVVTNIVNIVIRLALNCWDSMN